ncbi:MAG: secretin N-terminal domain-containing protein [Burkholderiales bacterium]
MPGNKCLFRRSLWVALAGVLGSCATYEPTVPPSEGHITAPAAPPAAKDIPPPVKTPAFVPPPKPVEKLPTYSVVVTDVPAKELLFALSRDTKTDIDVHPGIQGLVTLSAINETLPGILDRISRQIDIRYRKEGNTLIVEPDAPYFKTYRINYLNLERNTKSVNSVATQISSTGGGTTATGGGTTTQVGGTGGTSSGNTSSTTVESESRNNFFAILERNIQTILASTRALKQSADQRAAQSETIRQARLAQVEAAARAGAAAPALFNTAGFGQPPSTIPPEVINEVSVNPLSGTISVLATERQHQLIQQHIDITMGAVTRQVLIEATIVEVRLFDNYQAGIDFSLLADGAGFNIVQQLFQDTLDNNPVSIGYADPEAGIGNVNVAIRFLEQFGKARVLSSPRLMALNNQTALLKVVDNRVFFTIEATTSLASVGGTVVNTFNTTVNTVPVGLVMYVTPQIDENKSVILNVRPTVSRIINFVADPNPSLRVAGQPPITNLIPEIQAREIESVLKVGSGQTVILGGLMQDDVRRERDGIPFLAKQPSPIGDIFSFRDEAVSKTELVIFLRPIVVPNPSLESDELKFLQRYLPNSPSAPQ